MDLLNIPPGGLDSDLVVPLDYENGLASKIWCDIFCKSLFSVCALFFSQYLEMITVLMLH